MKQVFISEIFPTIQGEGPYTGERQIFVRMAGCPLRCDYCDTPASLESTGHPQYHIQTVLEKIMNIANQEKIKTVSVTGGEPLSQVPFLQELFPKLKQNGFRIYLETAGVHPSALKLVIEDCDVVAMDIKLPSATGREYWDQHKKFIEMGQNKVFVKIVIEEHTPLKEVQKAISLLENSHSIPLLVLQPVTPQGEKIKAPPMEKMEQLAYQARMKLPHVRIMPQQHKIWAIR